MSRFIDVPPVWLLGSAALAFILSRFVPLAHFDLPDWFGWAVFAAGLAWAIAAVVQFAVRKTPVEPHRTPQVLLTGGPFRLNRNPTYSGMSVMLLCWALVLGTASAFAPVLLFPILIAVRFVRAEEHSLRQAFGAKAEEYLSRTRRW